MTPALLAISVLFSLGYGLFYRRADPSWIKVTVKTVPVTCFALIALTVSAPPALVLALTLCALGDAFLALDTKRGFLPGLVAFLLGHCAYVVLFLRQGQELDLAFSDPPIAAAAIVTVFFAVAMFLWLRPSLGTMVVPVFTYVSAIATMAISVLTLPAGLAIAIAGAYLFVASDAVLAIELFKPDKVKDHLKWTSAFVWGAYYLGQMLILLAFLPVQSV